ncbi:MAG TPA: glycosyltransferase family A protein [Chloroflexota bacterium]|nr:glycosyltransferase family A protein [Chloroflexota bacterium]
MTHHEPIFTVITPTHNRAGTLPRVYDSLVNQTFRDFEWVIVDDGSTDDTRELVQAWQSSGWPPIRYVILPTNRGILAARNRGVEEATGRFVLFHDSDDMCVPNALERFNFHWESIPARERAGFVGVTAQCVYPTGEPVGSSLPMSPLDSNSLEMSYRYRLRGEMWGIQRTDILREHPFPPDRGANEGVVWFAIARRYRTRYVQEQLRVYCFDEPARRDQFRHMAPRDGARGAARSHAAILDQAGDWLRYDPVSFARSAAHYVRFSLHDGRSIPSMVSGVKSPVAQLLVLAGLPVGAIAYLQDRRAERRAR